jgi:hydrogenase maturation protease
MQAAKSQMKLRGLNAMSRVLIIGCGNPLRCDDGLAWRAADELSRRDLPENIEIIMQHQLTPELAFAVRKVDTVLFLDAAQDGDAGELRCEPVKSLPTSSSISHEFSPSAILGLAQELYGKTPRAFLLSLCGECFEHGEKLSKSVEQRLPHLLALIVQMAQKYTAAETMAPELVHG